MTTDPVISDRTANASEEALATERPATLVNLFTSKPGMSQTGIKAPSAQYRRLSGKVEGYVGSRLGRAADGEELGAAPGIVVGHAFEDSDIDHMDIIRPLIDRSAPGLYAVVYSAGQL